MALFRTSLRSFSRSKGESATAAAAYRAGVDLVDRRVGMTHRFSQRQGVEAVRVFAPPLAPAWASDVEKLWNAVEAAETRSNSRVARELVVSLPHELSAPGRLALAEEISRALVARYAIAVMLAMHAPDAKGDQRNHHCHILISTRALGASGFTAKVRDLDDRVQGPLEVEFLRELVEQRTNAALQAESIELRVDRRSLRVRAQAAEAAGDFDGAARLTREPTLVVGRAATAAARRGVVHERAQANASIRAAHEQDLAAYLARAHAAGRLMPPSTDRAPSSPRHRPPLTKPVRPDGPPTRVARVTGPDARALNERAAALEESTRAAKKAARKYVESVLRDVRKTRRWLDAYLALIQREHERELWELRCANDRELMDLLRQSVEAQLDLLDLQKAASQRQAQWQVAVAHREQQQREAANAEQEQAPVWNIQARRRWKAQHVAQGARLRQAVLHEQQLHQATTGTALTETRRKAAVLRATVAKAEEAIRRRLNPTATDAMPGPVLRSTEEWRGSAPARRLH